MERCCTGFMNNHLERKSTTFVKVHVFLSFQLKYFANSNGDRRHKMQGIEIDSERHFLLETVI